MMLFLLLLLLILKISETVDVCVYIYKRLDNTSPLIKVLTDYLYSINEFRVIYKEITINTSEFTNHEFYNDCQHGRLYVYLDEFEFDIKKVGLNTILLDLTKDRVMQHKFNKNVFKAEVSDLYLLKSIIYSILQTFF